MSLVPTINKHSRRSVRMAMERGLGGFSVIPFHARWRRIPSAAACERCRAWTPNGGGCVGRRPGRETTLPGCFVWPDGSMVRPIEHGADGPRLIDGQERFWRLRVDADGVAWTDPIVESDAWRAWDRQPQSPQSQRSDSPGERNL
jgi:hypothetical protein